MYRTTYTLSAIAKERRLASPSAYGLKMQSDTRHYHILYARICAL